MACSTTPFGENFLVYASCLCLQVFIRSLHLPVSVTSVVSSGWSLSSFSVSTQAGPFTYLSNRKPRSCLLSLLPELTFSDCCQTLNQSIDHHEVSISHLPRLDRPWLDSHLGCHSSQNGSPSSPTSSNGILSHFYRNDGDSYWNACCPR